MSHSADETSAKRGPGLARVAYVVLWALAIVAFLVFTNTGFVQRVELLLGQERLSTLAMFVALWGFCAVAFVVAALQSNLGVRAFWAIVLAFTTAAGLVFRLIGGNEIGVLDVISLWTARHEAGRAEDFYQTQFKIGLAVFAIGALLILFAPRLRNVWARRWIGRLAWLPLAPVILIAAIVYLKEGGGSQALPVQFQPLSVAAVSGAVLATSESAKRPAVTALAGERQIQNVVFLVDESVRGDYIDWTPGNRVTPVLAAHHASLADFGPALSGGNCSAYSNAILRFAVAPADLGSAVLSVPTIWQYAKRAGFRTVFIDAQAAFNKNSDKFQNFMSADEAADIDAVYFLPSDTPAPELDFKLLDIVRDEMKSTQPVFIYANKNGAHFPYDHDYPEDARTFHPTMTESAADTAQARINSYRNAISWSVDGFFKNLFAEIDLSKTALIYTSDHGQVFNPAGFTHCSVEDPDPREAVVPLFMATGDPTLSTRFAEAATRRGAGQSHFSIAPTILELFGYDLATLDRPFAPSLLDEGKPTDFFTTGDIFGLFSETRRHVVDPRVPRLEDQHQAVETSALQ